MYYVQISQQFIFMKNVVFYYKDIKQWIMGNLLLQDFMKDLYKKVVN